MAPFSNGRWTLYSEVFKKETPMNFWVPNSQFLGRKRIGNENGRNSKTVMPHTTMFDCERGEVTSKMHPDRSTN